MKLGYAGRMMNYTKTAALILFGTLIVKVAYQSSIGANMLKAGGAIPTMILAAIAILPIMVVADWRARRKTRRDDPK